MIAKSFRKTLFLASIAALTLKSFLKSSRLLKFITTSLIASLLASSSAQAIDTVYQWMGSIDSNWATSGNWNVNGVPVSNGGGNFSRVNINGAPQEAVYSAAQGANTFGNGTALRGLVVGSGSSFPSGTLRITGGTLTTVGIGGGGEDVLGNSTRTGRLIIDGGAYVSNHLLLNLNGSTGILTLTANGGTATIGTLELGQSGSGNATVNLDGGTLTLSNLTTGGNLTATRTINFNGGTLKAGASFAISSAVIPVDTVVQSGGANFDTNGNTLTINNALTDGGGGGGLTKSGLGTVILGAANTYTGQTTVTQGTLQLGAADRISDSSNLLINGGTFDLQAFNETVGAVTLSSGGFISGTGALTGSAYALEGGTVNATLGAGAITVSNGATTLGSAGRFDSNSTLALNSGQLTLGGAETVASYTQTGGTLEVDIAPGGTSDSITVNGAATINGGSVAARSGGQTGFQFGQRFTILTATGGVIGVYDSVTDDLAFFDASLLYDANNVYIQLLRNAAQLSDVALTPNQIAVSKNLEQLANTATGDLRTILNAILALSANEARDGFDDLSGEVHGSLHAAQRQFSEAYLRQARNHQRGLIRFLRPGGSDGIVQGQGDGFAVTQQAGMSVPGNRSTPAEGDRRLGWVDGYAVNGSVEGNGNADGFDYDIGGTAYGFDFAYNEDVTLSIMGGYGQGNLSTNRNGDRADSDNATVSIGGIYAPNPVYVLGNVGYGYNDYETIRNINFGPINRVAEGNYDSHQLLGYLEMGIAGDFGPWLVTPKATAQYLHLDTEGFTETGAGAAGLTVAGDETSSLRLGAGVSISRIFELERGGGQLIPDLSAHYYHEALDNSRPVVGSFGGSGGRTFTSQGAALGRNFGEAGMGVTILGTGNIDIGFRYDVQFSEEHVAHQGSGGMQIRW